MKDEKGRPMTYWGGLEPTDPYERGFIDGMAKQRESSVDKWVNATAPQTKPLSDEEIYKLWCEADNTELLPEMRLKDGSINYIITTFAKLIEERHGIK